jgi:hypothetical protein
MLSNVSVDCDRIFEPRSAMHDAVSDRINGAELWYELTKHFRTSLAIARPIERALSFY